MNTGIYLKGICLGHRQQSGKAKESGNPYTLNFLGIEVMRKTAYGEQQEIVEVQIPKSLIDAGLLRTIQEFQTKMVEVNVYVTTYNGRNGSGYRLNLANGDSPIALIEKSAAKAA